MKKLLFCLLMTIAMFVLSCNPKKDTLETKVTAPVPDPAGTVSTNLDGTSSLILWDKSVLGGTRPLYYKIYLGMNVPAVTDQIFLNVSYGGSYSDNYMLQGETTDIGEVHGLGNVTEKPTTGFTFNAALAKGHGYIIRYKGDINYANSTLPYSYGRFYVVDYQLDVFGEIQGVTIKYQGPF